MMNNKFIKVALLESFKKATKNAKAIPGRVIELFFTRI